MRLSRTRPSQVALLCTAVALAWQWLIVAGFFHGHWSALFVAGDRFRQSPEVASESSYVLPSSDGYDGQLYHAMAHDPLDLHGTDVYMDAARFRYPRILIPGLSYILGFGQLFWVDRAYRALELASVFLGVFCVASYAGGLSRSPWWGALFLALPGSFISLERMLADLPLCALIASALLAFERGRRGWCWLALAAAGLDREMGIVVIAAFAVAELYRRHLRDAVIWSLAAAPGLLWLAYVTAEIPGPPGPPVKLMYPFFSFVRALQHPFPYTFTGPIVPVLVFLDRLAMAGVLAAFALAIWTLFRAEQKTTLAWVGAMLAAFGYLVSPILDYSDVYSFARQNSPLLLVQVFQTLRTDNVLKLGPLAAILPRAVVPGASMTYRSILYLLFRS